MAEVKVTFAIRFKHPGCTTAMMTIRADHMDPLAALIHVFVSIIMCRKLIKNLSFEDVLDDFDVSITSFMPLDDALKICQRRGEECPGGAQPDDHDH